MAQVTQVAQEIQEAQGICRGCAVIGGPGGQIPETGDKALQGLLGIALSVVFAAALIIASHKRRTSRKA